jgi:hypothetical protein
MTNTNYDTMAKIIAAMAIFPAHDAWTLSQKIDGEIVELSDWEKINIIMGALFAATVGSDEGKQIGQEWLRNYQHRNGAEAFDLEGAWSSWRIHPPPDMNINTLFGIAESIRRGWQQEWEARRRAEQTTENMKIGDDVTEPILPAIMTLEEMEEKLVFVGSIGVVVDRTTGRIRKKEHAFSEYSASVIRTTNRQTGKVTVTSILKLWIGSEKRMSVDALAWVPGSPQICRPPEPIDGAMTAFNSWRGIAPMDFPPDWKKQAEPFFEHVAYLIKDEAERIRFLQWLAHIIQKPEVLPHTAYLMMTPTTGIGRNWMASVIVRSLRGHVAAGVSLPELLDGGFTGRLSRKLLAIVDEAREGSGEKRYARAERIKSLITEEYRQINPKYGFQTIEKNCCRWLMFSNHRDAIPFDNNDRRIIYIENPTEQKSAVYYEKLYGLVNNAAFIGSVRKSLEMLDISSFKPGAHSPMNAARQAALYAMMSETERAVAEFAEDYPNDLTTRTHIEDFVEQRIDGKANATHLTHAIVRAGLINTGRRIERQRKRYSVVIVRGDWTAEVIKATSAAVLEEKIDWDWQPL